MPETAPDFLAIIRRLNAQGVPFVVIGGFAMILHGSTRVTFDLDLFYRRSRDDAQRIAVALADLNPRPREFPPDLPFIFDGQSILSSTILTLDTTMGKLDLLGAADGVPSFDELLRDSIEIEIEDVPLRIASLPHLYAMKRAANREKDQIDLAHLEALLLMESEERDS